jgi:hypothetical protein
MKVKTSSSARDELRRSNGNALLSVVPTLDWLLRYMLRRLDESSGAESHMFRFDWSVAWQIQFQFCNTLWNKPDSSSNCNEAFNERNATINHPYTVATK